MIIITHVFTLPKRIWFHTIGSNASFYHTTNIHQITFNTVCFIKPWSLINHYTCVLAWTGWWRWTEHRQMFVFCFFYNCIVPVGFLPWEVWVAFPGESQLQQSHATQPRVHARCFSVSTKLWQWTMGSLTCTQMFNECTGGGVQTP